MLDKLTASWQTVVFRVSETMHLPAFKGATFRGALGYAFRKTACALRRGQCVDCLVRERCAYSVCFETPVPESAEIMRKYPFAPHPFVLEPPLDNRTVYEPGETLELALWLIGRGQDYLPHFIHAFEAMARDGFGRDHAKAELVAMRTRDGDGRTLPLYDHAAAVMTGTPLKVDAESVAARVAELEGKPLRFHFITPLRSKSGGEFTGEPGMSVLFPGIARRLQTLRYFHCGGGMADVKPLLGLADTVETLRMDMERRIVKRYSNRQKASMDMDGFTGTVDYTPPPVELLPWLAWGECLHTGKASAFGFGQYAIETLAAP